MIKKRKAISKLIKIVTSITLVVVVLVLTGCSSNNRDKEIQYLSDKYKVSEDNQLVVWTSHKEEVYLPIIREFETRTGIWVDIRSGGTAELLDMIESSSGDPACDIMFGGGAESYEARKSLFAPYKSSEMNYIKNDYLSKDDLWTPFTELPIVFVYNPKLISFMNAPKSWYDLMDKKWKGAIAFADMDVSGTSYTIISIMNQLFNENLETLIPEFYAQIDGKLLGSSGDIIPAVCEGECLVGITLEETAQKYIKNGYDIKMIYPEDGTAAVPDACAIVKSAPHSYNAGKFIDFILEQDTQKYTMEQLSRRPVRTDIELSDQYGDIKLMDFDIEKSAGEETRAMDIWHSVISSGQN